VLPAKEPRREALRERLKLCDRLFALESRLPALLKGTDQPAAAELAKLADLSRDYGRTRAAVELYVRAFAAQPARLELDRYNAACAAALAGTGTGADAALLSDPERARLRRQALDWLRPNLPFRPNSSRAANPSLGRSSSGSKTSIWWTSGIRQRLRNCPPTSARAGSASGRTWRSYAQPTPSSKA
jgi:hypothetical protein